MNGDYTADTGSGYQCPYCWAWVPNGSYHTCPYTNSIPAPRPPQPAPLVYIDSAILERIAAALERIAAQMERANEIASGLGGGQARSDRRIIT